VLCVIQAEAEETVEYRAYLVQLNGKARIDNTNACDKEGTDERGVDRASIIWRSIVWQACGKYHEPY
jgi:hypothetical protein